MPQDIVREIFSHFSSTLAVCAAGYFPWYLGHICATWRATFLSMQSQFWKDVYIEWRRRRREGYAQRFVEILRFFLQCSQGSPFSFVFSTSLSDYTEDEAPNINQVLLILVSESTRWQEASMTLRASMLPTLYRVKHHLPLLQSLKLSSWSDDGSDYSIPVLYSDIFKMAPRLTSVYVYCLSAWSFNWSSLTYLHLDRALDRGLLYTVLPYAVRLKGLEIGEPPILSHSEMCAIEPIKLPCLIYLMISSSFLNVLEAPALLDLQTHCGRQDSTPETNIIDFIRRSSCALLHLRFTHRGASIMKQVLLHTPKVRYLCVGNVTDVFIWLSSNNPVPLAHLEALRVCAGPGMMEADDMEKLSHMVTSRGLHTSNDRGGLKKLTIEEYRQDPRTIHGALEHLRSSCRAHGIDFQYPTQRLFCKFCSMTFSHRTYETL